MRVTLNQMARSLGKTLVLLAIVLLLANAGCFARCLVEPCDVPPPCHPHGQASHDHCPDQHSLKAFAGDLATSSGLAISPIDRQAEPVCTLTQAFGFEEFQPALPALVSTSPPLRI